MKKHTKNVRSLSKVASIFIALDFLTGLYILLGATTTIISFWGFTMDVSSVRIGMLIDACLFLILVHYGWRINLKLPKSDRVVLVFLGILMTVVALIHAYRLINGFPIEIAGISMPLWISVIGLIIPAFMAYASFHYARVRS